MAQQNRKTLKEYFKAGNIPTEDNFSDLIDSMINIRNDGINRSQMHGFHVETTGEKNRLLSFFRSEDTRKPIWVIDMDTAGSAINFQHADVSENSENAPSRFTITNDGRIGVKNTSPLYEMDVNGTLCCSGRLGNYSNDVSARLIPADGEWHELLENLHGCQAFEIMAGVGRARTGKYALMHAVAMNIYGNRGKIRYTQSTYMSRNNAIRLKWSGNKKGFTLKMRTMCDYGETDAGIINVQYSITKLWFDQTMKGCVCSRMQ